MTQIVWIASYPKSGSGWVRSLVANLIYAKTAAAADLLDLMPDIHLAINASHLHGETTTFVKTHWQYHPKLPLREDTVGAIYVVRHPLDVMAANLNDFLLRQVDNYFGAPEAEQARIKTAYIDDFIARGGAEEWIKLGFGGWSENVMSWLEKGVPIPRLTARYEELQQDPTEFMTKLCQFCNLQRSPEEIAAAIEATSLERRQDREEQAAGLPGQPVLADQPARADGGSGSYRDILSAEQIAAAAERFRDMMQVFGYRA